VSFRVGLDLGMTLLLFPVLHDLAEIQRALASAAQTEISLLSLEFVAAKVLIKGFSF